MTSSAERALGVLLACFAAGMPVASAATLPPAPLAGEVRAEIAARWAVDAERVVIDWPASALERAGAREGLRAERVLGGPGGWFTVATGPGADAPTLRLRAGLLTPVAVAVRPLATGEHLGVADFRAETRTVFGPPSPAARPVAAGDEVRRPIAAGEALAWPAVVSPEVIGAGQPVEVTWERGGVQVRLDGVALQAARAGEPVQVRVAGRTGRLHGIAAAPGVVRLEGGMR